jgi:hypothetical protein
MPGVYDDRKPEQFPSKPARCDVIYSVEDVAKHASADDAWIIVNSFVYDITNFVRHHPGWTMAGQTSTIIAINRNLGKDCTEEFLAIHSRSAKRQLEDYMIGHVAETHPPCSDCGSVVDLQSLVLHLVSFLCATRDVLRLCCVSRQYFQALSAWMHSANDKMSLHFLWMPLALQCSVPTAPPRPVTPEPACSTVITGVQYAQTAVLLGPALWGSGRVVPTRIEIILKKYRAPGCASFGIVPEKAFEKDPLGSHRMAHTFDGLGRLLMPGKHAGEHVKALYGERLAEGDHLGLEVQPVAGQKRRVQCSFLINGRNLGIAFCLDASERVLPVLYFYPMLDATAMELVLPQHTCMANDQRGKVPQGLFFNELGPDLTVWLDIPMTAESFEKVTVNDVKKLVAEHRARVRPSPISAEQITVMVEGEEICDGASKLQDYVCYQNGLHVERLHWHILHLIS